MWEAWSTDHNLCRETRSEAGNRTDIRLRLTRLAPYSQTGLFRDKCQTLTLTSVKYRLIKAFLPVDVLLTAAAKLLLNMIGVYKYGNVCSKKTQRHVFPGSCIFIAYINIGNLTDSIPVCKQGQALWGPADADDVFCSRGETNDRVEKTLKRPVTQHRDSEHIVLWFLYHTFPGSVRWKEGLWLRTNI